ALFIGALHSVGGSVFLRFLAHDQERKSRRQRPRCSERDRSELGPRETHSVGLELVRRLRDALAQCGEDLRPRLETVLVEVMARVLSRAQDEVTLEIGVLAQSEPELLVGQGPVLRSSSRAIGISRSAPGEPLVRESMDPSSKYRSARSR